MTVPSYTEDLTDIATGDESTGWVELTGTDGLGEAYNAQGAPADQDNEYPYIQGSYAITQDCTKSTAVGSLAYSSGGVTIPTDGAFFVWHNFSSPFVMGTYAQGGYRICVGSGLGDFKVWYVGGSDKDNNPYGGFVNHVINPTVTEDDSAGTPTATLDYVGSAVYVLSGPSKGEPHQCDALRYGRGSAIFEYGETEDYCTIAGFVALNDAQAARWGLIQATSGGYLWKGRWSLGTATNAVDFRDSNQTIFLQWTPKVTTNFNTIEVLNASSNIELTGFNFIVLDPSGTASRGRWITTNDATIALTSCTFQDMYTFVFDSNTTVVDTAFKRCNQVTQGGASIDSSTFNSSDATSSLVVDSLVDVSDCTFIRDNSGYETVDTSLYLDGSDVAAIDGGTSWSDVTNSDDGSTATFATNTVAGTSSTITIEGTNYVEAGQITQVRARIYGDSDSNIGAFPITGKIYENGGSTLLGTATRQSVSEGWGDYATITAPSGGWTTAQVQALETQIYSVSSGTSPIASVAEIELEVSTLTNHAINLGTVAATTSMSWNNYLTGYETYSAGGTSTGNEAILVSVDNGQILTINVGSGYDTPSYYNTGAGTVSVVNSVDVKVYVKDTENNAIETASVAVYKSSDDTQIMNELSAVTTGLATESFAYAIDTDVYIRVRKSSTGTRYAPVKTTGTITSSGLTLTVVLNEDGIVT